MENNIEIKAVQSTELPILIQMARSTFISNYAHLNDPVYFQQYLDRSFELPLFQAQWADPHTLFYWAIVDGVHAGYCKFRTEAGVEGLEEAGNQILEIERIYVLDSHQKLGLGKRMLEKAIDIARQEGYSWIWLGVWKDNPKAIAWYQSQGFEAFGEHIFWMGDDAQTDWLMRKRV